MNAAQAPPDATPNERERLSEIARLDLFSDDVAALLDDLTTTAASELGMPISLVSVVLDEAQEFAASHGLEGWLAEAQGTPVEWAFCRHAVRNEKAFVVEDAKTHPLVHDNPLVTLEGVRCYAGIPLITSRGFAIGTLCVIGTEPKSFSAREIGRLEALAAETVTRIEARRRPT